MLNWIGRLLCRFGFHDYRLIEMVGAFGASAVGVAYMLMGDSPVSNTDPAATSKTTDSDWVVGLGAHLMMLIPDRRSLDGISTDPYNGGPWIMWPDTPYAHLMIPIDSFGKP